MKTTDPSLSCRQVEKIVQSFLDGELPDDRASEVEQHLARCEECGIEASRLDQVKEAISRLRQTDDTAATARVMARMRSALDS